MMTIDRWPHLGFERLGPDIDDRTAQLRAMQLSNFMRGEVHGPVYEDTFGLRYVDPDSPSGTPGDIPWRIDSMRRNHTVLADGSYREYIIALNLDAHGASEHPLAIAGLLVATKPEGRCSERVHRPTHIAEIDIARRMYGTGLALQLLRLLDETHAADPRIDLETYEGNTRSQRFHRKLGFVIDKTIAPRDGEVYEGRWITMATTGQTFWTRLRGLAPDI